MTRTELATILSTIEYDDDYLPMAYYQFPIDEAPDLPYLVYYYDENNDMIADNKNYADISSLTIELYTRTKSFDLEDTVEAVLKENNIVYDKSESFIDDELMYQITYESEVIINV